MVRRLLYAIAWWRRGLLRRGADAQSRNGPVDHADLKRRIELARDCIDAVEFDQLR